MATPINLAELCIETFKWSLEPGFLNELKKRDLLLPGFSSVGSAWCLRIAVKEENVYIVLELQKTLPVDLSCIHFCLALHSQERVVWTRLKASRCTNAGDWESCFVSSLADSSKRPRASRMQSAAALPRFRRTNIFLPMIRLLSTAGACRPCFRHLAT